MRFTACRFKSILQRAIRRSALSVCGRMAGMSLRQRFPICAGQRRKEWTVWRAFISTSFATRMSSTRQKIFSLRLMDFQAQAYPDARRKTRGACQLHRGGQSRSPVRPLCNRKRFSCLPPQAKMSWILYAISMRLSGYTSTRSISSSASSVVSVSASKIALDASLRLSCRACSSCFCFACANTAA